MRPWHRDGDHVVTTLDRTESQLLRTMVSQIRGILAARTAQQPTDELATITGIRSGPSTRPRDRVLARLLPDFSREDSILAGGMRQLHEPDLIDTKDGVAAVLLASCPETGGTVRLDPEQAAAWLSALTDVRLMLGTVLDVTEDMPDELPESDPMAPHLDIYQWLTYVQETLVLAVAEEE